MSNVIIARHGSVLQITLDRADKKNALTGAMYNAIIAGLDEADGDPKIGAVLLNGSGGSFTAGNDIADFLSGKGSFEDNPALRFIRRIAICDTPIVAAVEGVAVGVGTTLIFHCDLVYAAPDAKFRMPFVDLGLVPEAASSLLVPRAIGLHKASELLMLGEGFGAEEGVRLGVVNAVVPNADLIAYAMEKAQRLASKPRKAIAATRNLIRGNRDDILERIDVEARLFGEALRSDEAKAAFTAFLSKAKA